MKHYIFLLFAAFVLCTPVWADDEDDDDTPFSIQYARHHTIELGGGILWNLNPYTKLPSMACGYLGDHGRGASVHARYTYFLNRHWGAFMSAETANLNGSQSNISSKYDNEPLYLRQNISNSHLYAVTESYQALLGACYRFDFGHRWSLRSRLGLGYRLTDLDQDYYYARWEASLTHPDAYYYYQRRPDDFEEVIIRACNGKNQVINQVGSLALSPSIQLCFTPRRFFFFHLEAQWTYCPRTIRERIEVYDVHQNKVIDHHDDIYTTSRNGHITTVDVEHTNCTRYEFQRTLKSTTYHRTALGNFLALRLGVGWNIGKNK